jgi:hypothetical protein
MTSITVTRAASATARGSNAAFRPSSRSRVRIALGVLLSLLALGVMLTVFASADKRTPVLQAVRDVPAGTPLTADDLRVVEVSVDPSLAVISADQLLSVTGSYAKVRIVAGSLVVHPMLQTTPVVGAGAAVVAVSVPGGELPIGLRERSRVLLVFPQDSAALSNPPPVEGRVVGLPTSTDSVTGRESLSIEVAVADAATVAGAREVRIVLLEPGADPAYTEATSAPSSDQSSAEVGS